LGHKRQFGLIGNPLTHSFSKKYFDEKFEKENIVDCEFNVYPLVNINELPQLLIDNPYIIGLSVTLPYKESVIPFLNEIDITAQVVGAANCIKIINKQLKGYNTDVFGFKQSIKPFLESNHQRALILGTGGASKAVAYVLKEIGIDYFFVTRNKDSHIKNDNLLTYNELNENTIRAFKLIVNTTPVGMFPKIDTAPDIPYQFISSSHLLYDLVYNPLETEFLRRGKEQKASIVNGLSMLHQQAEEAWRIWNNG
jgi:shikimate dehydrogenase